jgi:hypothetical protein
MTKSGGNSAGPMVSWFDEAQNCLEKFQGLREDWDSYGGLPITPRSIESARKYLTRLAADTPRALVITTAQGGVSLEWITDQDHVDSFRWLRAPENLSIEFTPEGAIEVDEEDVADLSEGSAVYRAAVLARAVSRESTTQIAVPPDIQRPQH